ncbi:MAG: alpha/beta hydrolase [Spirochaetales bacterium]|nr:alpha/beta hydrolase [Spirochaetales bacterium]
MLQSKQCNVNGIRLHYVQGPRNGPPVVLVHGLSDCWQTFLTLIPFLYPYYTIYAPDLRGHGSSDRTDSYKILDYAGDIRELLSRLFDEPVCLIGHSLGAAIALYLAATHPEKCKSVTLIDPFVFDDIVHDENFRSYFTGCLEAVTKHNDVLSLFNAIKETGALAKKRALDLFRLDKGTITAVLEKRVFQGFELQRLLPAVSCPALLLRGNPDREGHITEAKADCLQKNLKDCAVEYLETASHVVHLDEPMKTAQYILFFLAAL